MAAKRRPTNRKRADEIRALMADPEIREIAMLAVTDRARDFVFRLAEYYTPTEIVLVLRAAKRSQLI